MVRHCLGVQPGVQQHMTEFMRAAVSAIRRSEVSVQQDDRPFRLFLERDAAHLLPEARTGKRRRKGNRTAQRGRMSRSGRTRPPVISRISCIFFIALLTAYFLPEEIAVAMRMALTSFSRSAAVIGAPWNIRPGCCSSVRAKAVDDVVYFVGRFHAEQFVRAAPQNGRHLCKEVAVRFAAALFIHPNGRGGDPEQLRKLRLSQTAFQPDTASAFLFSSFRIPFVRDYYTTRIRVIARASKKFRFHCPFYDTVRLHVS